MERKQIAFKTYENFIEDLNNARISNIRFDMLDDYVIVGVEMKNGAVMVYEDGKLIPGTLKNRKEFNEKYFTESV